MIDYLMLAFIMMIAGAAIAYVIREFPPKKDTPFDEFVYYVPADNEILVLREDEIYEYGVNYGKAGKEIKYIGEL